MPSFLQFNVEMNYAKIFVYTHYSSILLRRHYNPKLNQSDNFSQLWVKYNFVINPPLHSSWLTYIFRGNEKCNKNQKIHFNSEKAKRGMWLMIKHSLQIDKKMWNDKNFYLLSPLKYLEAHIIGTIFKLNTLIIQC